MTYKKKNEKIERDPVLVLLLSVLIIFYVSLGILMTFLIVTSHDPFALKIIIGVIWFAGYAGFALAFYLFYKRAQKIWV